ncbi:MAG: hypothetical protein PUD20_01240 [bacterium]|nr:hypothetical protein [bacterium]
MDIEKLKEWEIEETELDAIEDALEEKQNDIEARMDAAESNGNMVRKNQLETELHEVETMLEEVKKEIEAAKSGPKDKIENIHQKDAHGAVPTAVDEPQEKKHVIPTVLDPAEELKDKVAGTLDRLKDKKKNLSSEERKTDCETADDKKHEAELKKQAAMLRKKAADKEASEYEKVEREIKEDAEKATKETVAGPVSKMEKKLMDGVAAFAAGNMTEAYSKIYEVANAGKDAGLDVAKLGESEQLLARMYRDGNGTTKDKKRALFWFEKAAEHGNVEGCLALGQNYAEITPKGPDEETSNRVNALKYFAKAGNLGSKVGKEKFVEVCIKKKDLITGSDVKIACKFIDDLVALEKDEYIQQTLKEKKQELKSSAGSKAAAQRKRNSTAMIHDFRDVVTIAGALMAAFGVMLFCNNMLSEIDTFWNFSKWIPEHLVTTRLPIAILPDIVQEFGRQQTGNWGMLFMLIGWCLTAITHVENRGTLTNIVCESSLYFSAIAGFMAYYIATKTVYSMESLVYLVMWSIALVIVLLIARIPGMIVRYFLEA